MTASALSLADLITLLQLIGNRLKQDFVGKAQVVDLMIISLLAREHLLLVGPPGTAKSELVKRFVLLLGARKDAGDLFEYLLTRFTEPNEIFGPIDIRQFQSGIFTRNIEGALPKARIAFLDEVFKANSAILNALLTILNERFFFNGLQQVPVPLNSVFGATNEVPDGDDLAALLDRFLLRVRTDNVEERRFLDLLNAGWNIERERIRRGRNEEIAPVLDSLDDLAVAYYSLETVDLTGIYDEYRELVRQIRGEGITLSDRRAVKLLKLIAAATLLRQERVATPADLWVLFHIWNKPEQIPALQAIVGPVVERAGGQGTSAERSLDDLTNELAGLEQRVRAQGGGRVYTPTYYSALLHDLERVRQELLDHSTGRRADGAVTQLQELHDRIEALIDMALDQLEMAERL